MRQISRLRDAVVPWRDMESRSSDLLELTELAIDEDDASLEEQLEADAEVSV